MNLVQGVILGLIQGLTEFLPISSSAHLRVVPALLGWPDPGAAFSAVIQLGTLLAVLLYFFRDLWQIALAWFQGLWRREPFADPRSRLAWILIVGTLPIGIAGLVFKQAIETTLRSLWVVALALVLLALLLWLAEAIGKRTRAMEQISFLDGVLIGTAQALALIPGSSRSGVTITAGLFVGLSRRDAARFSFLVSVPAVAASGFYELLELIKEPQFSGQLAQGGGLVVVLVSSLVAFASGLAAIAGLLRYLQSHSTAIFIGYRLALGGLIAALLLGGVLTA